MTSKIGAGREASIDIGMISPPSQVGAPSAREVRQALDDLLQSAPFRTSRQCQRLLTYIVTHSLAGEDVLLRERVIGAETFGRPPDYDPGVDPVVRARAAEVRKRLAQYYASPEAKDCAVYIQIPVGSYKAHYEWRQVASAHREPEIALSAPTPIESLEPTEKEYARPLLQKTPAHGVDAKRAGILRRRSVVLLLAACTMGVLLTLFLMNGGRRIFLSSSERAFSDFWAPMIHGSRPTLIYSGTNPVYRLSRDAVNHYAEEHHIQNHGAEFVVDLNKDPELVHSLISEANGYVGTQDVTATVAIASSLARQNHPFELRYGQDVSIRDLRAGPDVMIGAFNNNWTLRMTDDLRYVFVNGLQIMNRTNPTQTWTVSSDVDYAIVSRLFDSKTGEALLTVAGIGQNGTEAAAEFITNPDQLAVLLSQAPRGWQNRNMQIVLSTSVVENTPGKAKVVATQYW